MVGTRQENIAMQRKQHDMNIANTRTESHDMSRAERRNHGQVVYRIKWSSLLEGLCCAPAAADWVSSFLLPRPLRISRREALALHAFIRRYGFIHYRAQHSSSSSRAGQHGA